MANKQVLGIGSFLLGVVCVDAPTCAEIKFVAPPITQVTVSGSSSEAQNHMDEEPRSLDGSRPITIILSSVDVEVAPKTSSFGRTSMLVCSTAGRCKWEIHKPSKDIGAHSRYFYIPLITKNRALRMRVDPSDAIAGILASALLIIGDIKKSPYYFMPWLVLTMRGFISCEGPSILRVGYVIIPLDGFPAAVFFFARAFLFMVELCVWSEVFNVFCCVWKIYMKHQTWEIRKKEQPETKESMAKFMREIPDICGHESSHYTNF